MKPILGEELKDVSLADQAKERIRSAILEGSVKPGERITIEQAAAELGISRTPIREALKALEVDGMVKLLPRRGAVVESFAREELIHRYEVRALLEGYAAWLACRSDPKTIAEALNKNCDTLEALIARSGLSETQHVRQLAELNLKFHAIIRNGCQSTTIIRLLESLQNPLSFTLHYWSDRTRQRASGKIHRQIARAFSEKKPALARKLVHRHLLEARDQLMKMDR